MASNHHLLAIFPILLVAAFAPTLSSAKQFIVGDGNGWTTGVDYNAWAQGKNFSVGDQLVFKYMVGAHNVYKVTNKTLFQSCTVPADEQPLTSGDDVITLTATGKKWYICGVANHCSLFGQKLAITVSPQSEAPALGIAPVPFYFPNNTIAPSPRHW